MNKIKNKKAIIIILIIVSIMFLVLIISNTENIQKVINKNMLAEEEGEVIEDFSYVVYDNKDENNIKILITINSADGIEYIEFSDGQVIKANNTNKIGIDYCIQKNQNLSFIVKELNKEKEEKNIYIDDEYIESTSIALDTLKDETGYKIFEVTNKRVEDGYTKTYYKIGTNGSWVEGSGKIPLLDYNVVSSNLTNGDDTVTVYAKITNPTVSDEIIVSQNYNLDTSNENNTYTADSLIKAIEDYNYGSGLATVTVNNQTYNLRVYQFDESKNIEVTTQFGKAEDVATASAYAQRMAVIKVNGDLTINSGATLTSYGTNYGGTKGLLIYCTGTVTNNGDISMTARGAKAVGENVYLWKNSNETYEYVPAGGAGGAGGLHAQRNGGKPR